MRHTANPHQHKYNGSKSSSCVAFKRDNTKNFKWAKYAVLTYLCFCVELGNTVFLVNKQGKENIQMEKRRASNQHQSVLSQIQNKRASRYLVRNTVKVQNLVQCVNMCLNIVQNQASITHHSRQQNLSDQMLCISSWGLH